MKINFKSRRLIASMITVLLVGFGIANPELIAPVATEFTCSVVSCDA